MTAEYLTDSTYYRMLEFLLTFNDGALAEHRDELVVSLGEKVGIWPEYTRPIDED